MAEKEEVSLPQTEINRVSVKPPPFYFKNPGSWFRQMDSQFVLAGITQSTTKYHHIMAALPEDIVANVLTDEIVGYEDLKKAVLDHLKANKHELIEQALAAVELGDKRPSQLVADIKKRFNDIGLKADDTIIKSRLLTALPTHLRSALVGHEEQSVDQYAKIADSMVAVAAPATPFSSVNATYSANNDRQPPRNNNFRNNTNRFSVRPFHPDQRPKICNAHIFYGERARSCRPWCRWPSHKPRMLRANEKTPHQSRSNSPTNV